MTHTGTQAGRAALVSSLGAIAIGVGVFFGWLLNIEFLRSLIPGVVAMNPVTGILFIFAGISLALALGSWSAAPARSRSMVLWARLCALVVTLVGLAKFVSYWCGADLPIDQILFPSRLSEGGHPLPNRIAPNSALNFMLLGSALLFVDVNHRHIRACLEFFIGIVSLGALTAVLGHAYHIHTLYGFGRFSPMSLYTGVAFLVISAAFFLAHTDRGLLAVFVGRTAGGTMARLFLPAAVIIPVALGWLMLRGQALGLYPVESGEAFFAVGNIVVFTLLICWSAEHLSQADLRNKKAEEALGLEQAEFRILFDLVPAMIHFKDTHNNHLRVNRRAAESLGRSVEEIEGKACHDIYPQQLADKYYADDLEVIRSGKPKLGILEITQDAEGRELWVSTDKVPYFDSKGEVIGIVVMARDVTDRVKTEESLRLLNSAVLQSDEAILITEAQLELPGPKIIFVNPAFTVMTGYTVEEVMGKTPRILQGPLTDKAVLARLRKSLQQGEVFEGEAINYRKDGSVFDLEWKVAPLRNPSGEVTHFVAIQRDVTDRNRVEARFRRLVDSNAQGVLFWDRNGKITDANDAFLQLIGYTREDLERGLIDWRALTPPEYADLDNKCLSEMELGGACVPYEKEFIRKDGSRVPILLGAAAFQDNRDEGVCFTLDLTQQKKLENQLFQSQKMETVGKLAGGIAHEFNSILTAIMGQSELLLNDLPAGSRLVKNATEINKAAVRAADLTGQLLAYGRKQILQPQILDLRSVLKNMEGALHQVMGQEVDIRIFSAPELKSVKADADQIEQVIMNIALNAHDAMPHGGKLTLEAANVSFDALKGYPEVKPGEYVMLAIADTGFGMPPEVQARVFEPFFSTKEVAHGAGLGLSTCYGIIKQSGGHIVVYSELGHGTVFKVYLPQVNQSPRPPALFPHSSALPGGMETILLVEDDPALREMAGDLLERLGYTVLIGANGMEALDLMEKRGGGTIDLLFTDVVMPSMNGKELSERVTALSPDTRTLFASAYTEGAIAHQGILDPGVRLLQKPFSPSMLAKKVREALDRAPVLSS